MHSRSTQASRDFLSELLKVSHVPCIQNVGFSFQGTMRQESIVDCSTYNSASGRYLNRAIVLMRSQCDHREAFR